MTVEHVTAWGMVASGLLSLAGLPVALWLSERYARRFR